MKTLVLVLLDFYRLMMRPFLPPACRFYPSCGDYAHEAVTRHGALRGGLYAAKRLLSCHPLHAGGLDPVPLSNK